MPVSPYIRGPGKMHRRELNTLTTLLGAVSMVALAGCSKEAIPEPRILSLAAVSGTGQSGFVGGLLNAPFVVRAADQDGIPVSGVQITWTVVTGAGVATPDVGVTDADGLFSTSYRLGNLVGTQTVQAASPGGQPVVFTATANAAPASQIEIVSGDNQTGVVQTTLQTDLTVKVTDAFGNPKEGVTIFFNVVLGNGTVTNAGPVSDPQGTARVKWTLGPLASTQRVTAQIPGALPAIFDATATPGPAALVVVVSGNNQLAAPGAPLPDSIVARVTDIYENPVKDVNVTWTPVGGNAGSVSPPAGKTDAAGRIAAAWTLGLLGGPKEVRATASGVQPGSFLAAGTIVFASVMAGGSHTCAVDTDRVAYCWGLNDAGQLGNGTAANGIIPANLSPGIVNSTQAFVGGSSGSSHSCAVTQANIAWCWGLNLDGRVGNGGQTSVSSPVLVNGGHSFRAVSGGDTHSCAITIGDRLFCWGSNAEGKLGIGAGTASTPTPVAVEPSLAFASVATGALHTCGTATSGLLYCWGNNAQGQAGQGPGPGPAVPTQVPGSSYNEVVAGAKHSCARQGTDVTCWGANESGQLGDGSNDPRDFPNTVPGFSLVSLTAGRDHTCGLDAAGRAYCWGLGTSGQLGNSTFISSNQPVSVALGTTFTMLSAGGNHTCGVSTGNVLYCWGENVDGALGDGTQTNRSVPTRTAFQP